MQICSHLISGYCSNKEFQQPSLRPSTCFHQDTHTRRHSDRNTLSEIQANTRRQFQRPAETNTCHVVWGYIRYFCVIVKCPLSSLLLLRIMCNETDSWCVLNGFPNFGPSLYRIHWCFRVVSDEIVSRDTCYFTNRVLCCSTLRIRHTTIYRIRMPYTVRCIVNSLSYSYQSINQSINQSVSRSIESFRLNLKRQNCLLPIIFFQMQFPNKRIILINWYFTVPKIRQRTRLREARLTCEAFLSDDVILWRHRLML